MSSINIIVRCPEIRAHDKYRTVVSVIRGFTSKRRNNIIGTLHEVITFLVSMQMSIISLQTHNVNRCGRSRHLARKLSRRRKRRSPNVFEMAATETITSIILIKLIRVSLCTVRHPRRFKIVVIDIQITLKQMLRDFIGIRVNRAKKSCMVNITSSVNSRERSGINTILHELNQLFTINVTMRDIKSKNVYSRDNSKATSGTLNRHTLGASLNIGRQLSSSKGPKPLQLKLLSAYIAKTSAFTLGFSTSQRLRTTRASARTFFTFRHYITTSARHFCRTFSSASVRTSVFTARTRKVNANNSAALTGSSTPLIMFSVNSAPSMMRQAV